MTTETVHHKGRVITLNIAKRGRQFTWSYQIDKGPVVDCNDRPLPSETLAHDEALEDAKWTIERMKKK